MRKWLIAIALTVLPTFALAGPFHGHMGGGMGHSGPAFHGHMGGGMVHRGLAFHGGHAFNAGTAFRGRHFASFGHGIRHVRHFRHFRHGRNFAFFAAAPYIASDAYCWRLVRTPYGLRRVWACNDDYYYDY